MRLISLLPAALAVMVAHLCPAATVRVSDDNVNLLAAARGDSEIVGHVSRGDTLKSTGEIEGEWVQVRPPSDVSLWVFGDLIRDGAVAANSLRVRSGPGIGYRPVGEIARGTAVQTRSRRGDWIEIVPPPGLAVWISKVYISGGGAGAPRPVATPKPKPKPTPKPVVKPTRVKQPVVVSTPKPVVKPVTPRPVSPVARYRPATPRVPVVVAQTPVARPAPRRGFSATPPTQTVGRRMRAATGAVERDVTVFSGQRVPRFLLEGVTQGETVSVRGRVSRSGFVGYLFSYGYRLMQPQEAGWTRSACLLGGDEDALFDTLGQSVALRGRRYWVQGRKLPVLMVDELQVLSK